MEPYFPLDFLKSVSSVTNMHTVQIVSLNMESLFHYKNSFRITIANAFTLNDSTNESENDYGCDEQRWARGMYSRQQARRVVIQGTEVVYGQIRRWWLDARAFE